MVAAVSQPSLLYCHDLGTLLSSGDWACAHQQPTMLAEVVRLLGPCLAAPDQIELGEIARLADTNIVSAAARWTQFSNRLRARLASPDQH
jgi:hypothetical protein